MATRLQQRRFEIVPMTADDLDDIMDIERTSFRAPWSRQVFVEELDRDWAHVDVLRSREPRSPVQAFVNYWLVRDEVHVLNVATHPTARRQGHAARLIEHVIAFAHRERCRYPPVPQVRLPPRRHPAQLLRRGQRGRDRHAAGADGAKVNVFTFTGRRSSSRGSAS